MLKSEGSGRGEGGEADELEAVGGFLEDLHADVAELYDGADGGNLTGGEEDVAGKGLIFVAFPSLI